MHFLRTVIWVAFFTSISLFSAKVSCEEMTVPRSATSVRILAHGGDYTEWRGWIVSPKGRVFRADNIRLDEKSAKFAAKGVCEKKGGVTCDLGKAIAIPETDEWVVSAIECKRGNRKAYFLGGSALGGSWDKAIDKAAAARYRREDCDEIQLKAAD